jgi:hypothetical protein
MAHIEEEYIFPAKKTVGFPSNLGYSGYAFEKNTVSFVNNFTYKQMNSIQSLFASVACFGKDKFTPIGFAFCG